MSTFLNDLEKYLVPFTDKLIDKKFIRTESETGAGLGASISYRNKIIKFELINDKGQFFVNISSIEQNSEVFDLSSIMSIIELRQSRRHFKDLTNLEKDQLYQINYSYSDPLISLFKCLDEVYDIFNKQTYNEIEGELRLFLKFRSKWLFSK